MNKRQKITKKLAKRAKARENQKEKQNPSSKVKPRYISKAERAKMELENSAEVIVESIPSVQS